MSKELSAERQKILNLEKSMSAQDGYLPGDGHCKITHHFAQGVYLREMFIPQNCLITGKIHKTEHLCILSQGKVTVANGLDVSTYEAPATILSKPGAKRSIFAHEDSTWTNVHPTELTDPEKIENEIIAESFEELDRYLENKEIKRIS